MVILFNYKNSRLVLLSVLLLSLSVETLQYVFRVGVADMDDVLLNTAGDGPVSGFVWPYKKVDPCIIQPPIVK